MGINKKIDELSVRQAACIEEAESGHALRPLGTQAYDAHSSRTEGIFFCTHIHI